ncbi:MAG: DNA polymerase III subunit beta [Candidatus Methylomirabilales bacterium]|nr:DNA polymerase III subunit beta [candidate division NC10 bacterium]
MMHAQVVRSTFLSSLGRVQGVIEAKRTLPILSHILVEARGNTITLSGTDLDVSIQTSLHGDIKQEGRVAISGKKLYEITRELPDAPIDLRWEEGQHVEILCAKSTFRLKGIGPEEFPTLPEIPEGAGITIAAETLRTMIPKTLIAVSTDQTRPTLAGALLQLTESELCMVATDGHRLSLVRAPTDTTKGGEVPEAIIPRKALAELGKMLKDESGDVRLVPLGNQIAFLLSDSRLITRLIEGQFPNYQQVLPSPSGSAAVIRREDLQGALRRASTIAGDRATPTTLDLKAGRLVISCTNIDLGEAREELSMEYRGPEITAGFNAKYLLDFLGVVEQTEVSMHIHDPLSPALFEPQKGEGFSCVIMPMRI